MQAGLSRCVLDVAAPYKDAYFVEQGIRHEGCQRVLPSRNLESLVMTLVREQKAFDDRVSVGDSTCQAVMIRLVCMRGFVSLFCVCIRMLWRR